MKCNDFCVSHVLDQRAKAVEGAARKLSQLPEGRIKELLEARLQDVAERTHRQPAPTDRVGELERQLATTYYKSLSWRDFSRLTAEELLYILPALIDETLSWGHGNGYLMWFAYDYLDHLPRDQARDLYLQVFAQSMRVYGMNTESPDERLLYSAETFVTSQQIYHSQTGHENQAALRDVIRVGMGERFVALYDEEWLSIWADDAADATADELSDQDRPSLTAVEASVD